MKGLVWMRKPLFFQRRRKVDVAIRVDPNAVTTSDHIDGFLLNFHLASL